MTELIRSWPDSLFYFSQAGTANVREQVHKTQLASTLLRALSDASTVDSNGSKLNEILTGLSLGNLTQRHKWRMLYDTANDRLVVQRNTGTDAAKSWAERLRIDASGNLTTTGDLTTEALTTGGTTTLGGTLDANGYYFRNVDKIYTQNGVDIGSSGALRFDQNSSFRLSSDDVVALRLGGIDAVQFDGDVASPANGLILRTAAASSRPTIAATGTDTNVGLDLVTKGDEQVTVNGVEVHDYTYEEKTANQNVSGSTETDITSLTALDLPNTSATLTSRNFLVFVNLSLSESSGSANLIQAKVYNGANGTKADTLVRAAARVIAASSLLEQVVVGPFIFTPGASDRTKIGVAVTSSGNCSVGGINGFSSSILVREVI